jgi:hypothetical protein
VGSLFLLLGEVKETTGKNEMAESSDRVGMGEFPVEVQEFYKEFKDYLFEHINKYEDSRTQANIISAAVGISIKALYLYFRTDSTENRIEREKDIQRVLQISCELAREAIWEEEVN